MPKGSTEMNAIINRPVDKKARQMINREVAVAQLGRSKIKGEAAFSEANALMYLDKHLRKKKKEAPVHFLIDRIRFTKKGFHEYLLYREILHFHLFPHRPDVFMLYTNDEKKRRHSYESYKCSSIDDVHRIRDMIYAASADPRRILQDSGPTRLLSVSSSSSSEYFIEKRPRSQYSTTSRVQTNYTSPVYTRAPSPVYTRAPSPVVVYNRPQSADRRIEVTRRSSYRPAPPVDDITYLRTDNINGPQIMDRGPVYMYVSRSRQNLNRSWSEESFH